jgi:deazaflavin-dependent oxidoreductase (nitroreductase family)
VQSNLPGQERAEAPAARPFRNPRIRRAALGVTAPILNPVVRALAGRRHFPLFAVIRHRGRRSGRWYATPVAARPTPEGFVVPLTFGNQADWFRNLEAAGGVVRWKGEDYPVADPRIVDWAAAQSAFSATERFLVPRLGIEYFAWLRRVPSERASKSGGRTS